MVCGIGEGVINYRSLFQQFPALLNIPMSIELPIGYGYDAHFDFALQNESTGLRETPPVPHLSRIRRIPSSSMDHLYQISA